MTIGITYDYSLCHNSRHDEDAMQPQPKGNAMSHGHVTGLKKEKKGSQDWYKVHEQANIDRITKEWEAKQQQVTK